jgi:DNA modification methylase
MLSPDTPFGIRTPKRGTIEAKSRSNWFSYYAGFSSAFAEDVLAQLNLATGATLLDPWLGAGTTGEVALIRGLQFKGYDLNPAMLLVAKARTFSRDDEGDLPNVIKDISTAFVRKLEGLARSPRHETVEPLEQWLQPRSARAFRALETIVGKLDKPHCSSQPTWSRIAQISPAVSVLYVAMFRTLRHYISHFQSSNPTWIKLSRGRRVQVSDTGLLARFLKEVAFLQNALNADGRVPLHAKPQYTIAQASSTDLPLKPNSIDAILSSPPYCTRIDYVRATLPELALVGYPNGTPLRDLRNKMMGTPTISDLVPANDQEWGLACNNFLSRVATHSSKASSTYYLKYFRQYFATAYASLAELDRVLKKSGHCVLVVQDSYYKDVLNNLPLIFSQMAGPLRGSTPERSGIVTALMRLNLYLYFEKCDASE